jgi:hypothetical protein
MVEESETEDALNFKLDRSNLYLEESFTDLKVGSVKRFSPVKADGSPDKERHPIFVGQTSVYTPHGPLPIQNVIPAKDLPQAFKRFPEAMQASMEKLMEEAKKMREEKQPPIIQSPGSRIIMP